MSDDSDRKPRRTIRPRRSWVPADPAELWEFRGLLTRFAARDITLRYRQMALGVSWVVLQPLLGAGILAFVFSNVAKLPAPAGVPYIVLSLAGMVAWTAFSQVVNRSSGALVANAQLVSKVFFPRLLLPISTVLSVLLDVAVSIGLLAVVMALNAITPTAAVVLLPVWLALIIVLALGIGIGAGALMVRYRDVQFALPVAVQFILYVSPVAYTLNAVPHDARWLFALNPLTGLLEGFRWSALSTPAPSAGLTLYSAAASVILLVGGLMVFSRTERQFADVI